MRNQFRDTCIKLAADDDKLVLIFGDISVYLFREFQERYPQRFFNAGICENTLVSMAAGLSAAGFRPVVHTIAPFITERSYEQVKLDICYNNFPACIVSCGGSFDYAWDGATHHCYTDLELMRMLPDMIVAQPGSNKEFDTLFSSCFDKAAYVRIAGDQHGFDFLVEIGKGVVVKESSNAGLTIATAGPILGNVMAACSDLPVNVLYFPTIKPLDVELIRRFSATRLLVIHDAFGLFEAINGALPIESQYYGIPDRFCCHYGSMNDIRQKLGLDPAAIREQVMKCL